ncbi:protein-glutamine gamma-glutamyltransferase K-like [Physella acuta]|uniref:protein-glutamine gamma-glutamyltransferase K-like n=1 Tax=Physella acuta TaxID=109671 RepID=UPI0027DC773A|nr:protein-glutamine gamma-glutamyltransferase K-like [Physella acuta]
MVNIVIQTVTGQALQVSSIDFHKSKNGSDHHTWEYEVNDLVVRRGKVFSITISFDRDVDVETDSLVVQLAFGSRPQESKETLLRLKLNLEGKNKVSTKASQWSAGVHKVDRTNLEVQIFSPANALVGKYGLFIETMVGKDEKTLRRYESEDEEIYLLFNPWCEADVVYMSDGDDRYEYVLNDHGRIWVGSASNNNGRPWYFGQFDNPVLDAVLLLMDRAEIGDAARRSPISFVRTVSALVNSNDDDGVLEGRWTKKYPKGSHVPWSWSGSVRILQEFMQHNKPVQFGQCWVFSGLVTSLLRAIGIPTRCVTNFESAHDRDSSMTIDSHFDEDGEPLTWMNDSVWNFHVWNESYFRRLDLPDGYDGWQAHDATPQEVSEGVTRCGPAPVKAVKEGHVYLNYDVAFIFSEVNGDKVTWKVLPNDEMIVMDINSHAIGKHISTKAVGSNFRHDLTLDYKYPEGSLEEKKVVEFVHQHSSRAGFHIYGEREKDIDLHLVTPSSASIGENFQIVLRMKNKSKEDHQIEGRVTVLSSFYTGVPDKRIKSTKYDVEVTAGEENDLILDIVCEDYMNKLNPEATMIVYASLNVKATKQQFALSEPFSLSKPSLDFTIPDVIVAKQQVTGTVSFTNPLEVSLTSATICLDGTSIISDQVHPLKKAIKPGEKVSFDFTICPRRQGLCEIEATLTSDQLSGVDGSVEFIVQPADQKKQ